METKLHLKGAKLQSPIFFFYLTHKQLFLLVKVSYFLKEKCVKNLIGLIWRWFFLKREIDNDGGINYLKGLMGFGPFIFFSTLRIIFMYICTQGRKYLKCRKLHCRWRKINPRASLVFFFFSIFWVAVWLLKSYSEFFSSLRSRVSRFYFKLPSRGIWIQITYVGLFGERDLLVWIWVSFNLHHCRACSCRRLDVVPNLGLTIVLSSFLKIPSWRLHLMFNQPITRLQFGPPNLIPLILWKRPFFTLFLEVWVIGSPTTLRYLLELYEVNIGRHILNAWL